MDEIQESLKQRKNKKPLSSDGIKMKLEEMCSRLSCDKDYLQL
jgi:hypothetical protein